jgi:hypothetical protein
MDGSGISDGAAKTVQTCLGRDAGMYCKHAEDKDCLHLAMMGVGILP